MGLRVKVVVTIVADEILATLVVTDGKQQVLSARRSTFGTGGQRQKAGAHIVLTTISPLRISFVKDVLVFPHLQIVGDEQVNPVALFIQWRLGEATKFIQDKQIAGKEIILPVLPPNVRGIR